MLGIVLADIGNVPWACHRSRQIPHLDTRLPHTVLQSLTYYPLPITSDAQQLASFRTRAAEGSNMTKTVKR